MAVDFRTRVELTCWDLIIPTMTKLRCIRTAPRPNHICPLTLKKFVTQVFIWSAAGLFIGIAISSICAVIQ